MRKGDIASRVKSQFAILAPDVSMTGGTRICGARDGVRRGGAGRGGKGTAVVKWASCTVCVGSCEGSGHRRVPERNGTGAGWPVGWRFSGWSVALIR